MELLGAQGILESTNGIGRTCWMEEKSSTDEEKKGVHSKVTLADM